MKIRFLAVIVISLLAVPGLIAFVAADDAIMASGGMMANDTTNDVIESVLTENVTAVSEGNLSSEINVQGIWRLSLEDEDITMALEQSNDEVFGQVKNEAGIPWNGVAAGLLSGNKSYISVSALVGEALMSTFLDGKVDGDIIKGNYIQSDGSMEYNTGEFTAIMISPDVSVYERAFIELPPDKVQPDEVVEDANEKIVEPAAVATKSRFKSVTDLAKGINPNIMPNMAPI